MKNILLPIVYSYKEKRDLIFSFENEEILRTKLRKIKEESISIFEDLMKKTLENLRNNGVNVLEAKDSNQAQEQIKQIIGKEDLLVKSKSNLLREIGFKENLKGKNIVETDLGDFILDLFNEEHMHPVLPAWHLTPDQIRSRINRKFNVDISNTPESIATFIREQLRISIVQSKIGISGANVISSEGSIFLLENEGNISLISRIPDKHIIVAGIDRIVQTREDALHVTKCAAIYGTGQKYPVYVNIISGPSQTSDIQNKIVTGAQGAKDIYVILVDNGRKAIMQTDFKELLYCINCGACINFCPVFHQITNKYGSKFFLGAKGVITSFFLEGAQKSFNNGAFYCTMCRQCEENCPAKIDLPNLIRKLRGHLVKEGIEPTSVKEMINKVNKYNNPFGRIEEGKIPDKMYCC